MDPDSSGDSHGNANFRIDPDAPEADEDHILLGQEVPDRVVGGPLDLVPRRSIQGNADDPEPLDDEYLPEDEQRDHDSFRPAHEVRPNYPDLIDPRRNHPVEDQPESHQVPIVSTSATRNSNHAAGIVPIRAPESSTGAIPKSRNQVLPDVSVTTGNNHSYRANDRMDRLGNAGMLMGSAANNSISNREQQSLESLTSRMQNLEFSISRIDARIDSVLGDQLPQLIASTMQRSLESMLPSLIQQTTNPAVNVGAALAARSLSPTIENVIRTEIQRLCDEQRQHFAEERRRYLLTLAETLSTLAANLSHPVPPPAPTASPPSASAAVFRPSSSHHQNDHHHHHNPNDDDDIDKHNGGSSL